MSEKWYDAQVRMIARTSRGKCDVIGECRGIDDVTIDGSLDSICVAASIRSAADHHHYYVALTWTLTGGLSIAGIYSRGMVCTSLTHLMRDATYAYACHAMPVIAAYLDAQSRSMALAFAEPDADTIDLADCDPPV